MLKLFVTLTFLAFIALPWPAAADSFEGTAYAIGSPRQNPLFKYIRKEEQEAGVLRRIHVVFSGPTGETLATEETELVHGQLSRYTLTKQQLGERGSLDVRDGRIYFTYFDGTRTRQDDEKLPEALVVASTVVPFLQAHWPELKAGKTVEARYAALDRRETVGFKFFKDSEATRDGVPVTVIKMKPTSFVIAAIVDPLLFTLDTKTAKLLELIGRTTPKVRVDGKWRDLDADILYR